MHNGHSEKYLLYYQQSNIAGTHVHGIFGNNGFRTAYFRQINVNYQTYDYALYRENQIQSFVDLVEKQLDCDKIIAALANGSAQ